MKINIDNTIFKKNNVNLAYLFGSQAKGNIPRKSDFDIAVLFKKDALHTDYFDRAIYLAEELRDYFPSEIDIVALNKAGSLLKYEVISNGQILYCCDEKFRLDFEVYSVNEYIDDKYIRDIYYTALKERVKNGAYQ